MSSIAEPLSLHHPQGIGKVHFLWSDDRFDHAIELDAHRVLCQNRAREIAWPDSPPIQQLSIESIDGRDVALGVGCAGTSHWSLSVEPTPDGFRFDWACRAKETPAQLGTCYDDGSAVRFAAGEQSVVSTGTTEKRIQPNQPLSGAATYRWCYTVTLP